MSVLVIDDALIFFVVEWQAMNKIKSSEAPEIYLTSFITQDCFLAFEALLAKSRFCGEKQDIFSTSGLLLLKK